MSKNIETLAKSEVSNQKYEIRIEGYEDKDYKVSPSGVQGRVSLPKRWVGKRIKAILLDPPDEQS